MPKRENLILKQRKQYKKQFGKESPFLSDKCKYCGETFGLHYDSKCPKDVEGKNHA